MALHGTAWHCMALHGTAHSLVWSALSVLTSVDIRDNNISSKDAEGVAVLMRALTANRPVTAFNMSDHGAGGYR